MLLSCESPKMFCQLWNVNFPLLWGWIFYDFSFLDDFFLKGVKCQAIPLMVMSRWPDKIKQINVFTSDPSSWGQWWILRRASPSSPCQVLQCWWIKPKSIWPNASWTSWAMASTLVCRATYSTASGTAKSKHFGASPSMTASERPKRFLNWSLSFCTRSRTLCKVGERNKLSVGVPVNTDATLLVQCSDQLSFPFRNIEIHCIWRWRVPSVHPVLLPRGEVAWPTQQVLGEEARHSGGEATSKLLKRADSVVLSKTLKQYFSLLHVPPIKFHEWSNRQNCPLRGAVVSSTFQEAILSQYWLIALREQSLNTAGDSWSLWHERFLCPEPLQWSTCCGAEL